MMIVLRQVWDWLRRWGGWIAGPLGTALFLLWRRRATVPADTTLKDKVVKETNQAVVVATEEAAKQKAAAIETSNKELAVVLQKEVDEVPPIVVDEGKLNEFLLEVGKQAREKEK